MYRRYHAHRGRWDMIIIGGGATGVGVAIDAASRGYRRCYSLSRAIFLKGHFQPQHQTGARRRALPGAWQRFSCNGGSPGARVDVAERPSPRAQPGFVVPNYDWWEAPFYGIGLKLYNLLAGKYKFGTSRILSREETLQRLPSIRTEGLRGGVIYYDGQFDDSRLLVNMVATAFEQGATLLNYAPVTALTKDAEGFVDGVRFRDTESGEELEARGQVVINATGPFVDNVRRMADESVEPIVAPSQGVHLVFDSSFLSGDSAIMVPHTSDGRVMFAIPWHGHTLVGTTDTPVPLRTLEPAALEQEVEFILQTAGLYLQKKPSRDDVLSVFAGIRPLVRSGQSESTAALSRDHVVRIENSGLVTICGGKWTTYRHMAGRRRGPGGHTGAAPPEKPCVTSNLRIHGLPRGGQRSSGACGFPERTLRPCGNLRRESQVWPNLWLERSPTPGRRSSGRPGTRWLDAGRRSSAADTSALPQRQSSHGHGATRGRTAGPRNGPGRHVADPPVGGVLLTQPDTTH